MECCTSLRNIQDLLSDGKTPYERRFGKPFKGPIIPFVSLVEYYYPGVVHTAEEACLQPRDELEAAVDSICKHVKELGALHVAESDVGEIFLPGRSAKLGSAFSELPGAVVDLRYGWDLASAAGRQECWKTLHAERPELVIGSPPSRRHSPWIKDEREARLQGIKHLNFCCAVYRWQTERGVHFFHEHPWGASSWTWTA